MIFKNMGSGFFWGVGFSAAILLVFVVFEKIERRPGKGGEQTLKEVKALEFEKISSKVESVYYFKERIIVSTSVMNGNSVLSKDMTLYVTIYYEDKPIDECSELYFSLDGGESKKINVYCSWRWKDLDKEKLSAKTRIKLSRY